jgi:hypothetical protein
VKKRPASFVFSMTAGRTGTGFLADLLEQNIDDAEVHHEILGYDTFGVDTPDVSHLTLFNSQGNVEKVQSFWEHKFDRIQNSKAVHYIETSHILFKAGLVENLHMLPMDAHIYFIALTRDPVKTVMSYRNRYDFINSGNMWMWYLDPAYPNNLVDATPYKRYGLEGVCLWYLSEIRTRTEYYRLKLSGDRRVTFLDVDLDDLNQHEHVAKLIQGIGANPISDRIVLPPKANAGPSSIRFPGGYAETLISIKSNLGVDARARAMQILSSGKGFD